MSAVTDEILDKLKSLTLLEAAELVKQIEEAFGVSAAAPVGGFAVAAAPGAGAAPLRKPKRKQSSMSFWKKFRLTRRSLF